MATWSPDNVVLTSVGQAILSKVQAGVGGITVSRIVTGSTYISPALLYKQTTVSGIQQTCTIVKTNTDKNGSEIAVTFSNKDLTVPYDLYTIGVYVTHPDYTGEQLYMIAECNQADPDNIPVPGETPVTLYYSLYMEHSGTTSVTITVDPSGTASVEDLAEVTCISAPTYSNASTYAVGDFCTHSSKFYYCNTAITVAEEWNAAHWTETSVGGEIKILKSGKAAISHSALVTLLAASWSIGSYTLTNEYITATNVVEMLPAEGITADQLKAAQKANIVGGTQIAGSMSLIALGTVPTIDIPVKFVFRGDL